MEQPQLWKKGENFLCLLHKSLYGLHQSGKEWNDYLSILLTEMGFKQCISDPCVFINKDVIIGVYVDDMVLVGEIEIIEDVKSRLSEIFEIKDFSEASHLLGMDITRRKKNELTIDQENYINDVLQEFGMTKAKGCVTPGVKNEEVEDDENQFDKTVDQHAIGRLQYLATCTRPDIPFIVNKLSRSC